MARRRKHPVSEWFFGILFTLVGMGIVIFGVYLMRQDEALETRGITTEAKIIRVESETSSRSTKRGRRRSSTVYRPIVRFTDAAGTMHEGASILACKEHKYLQPGSHVTITYLPENPDEVLLAGDSREDSNYMMMLLGGIFAAVGGGITIRCARK